jgi:hypothetical protein
VERSGTPGIIKKEQLSSEGAPADLGQRAVFKIDSGRSFRAQSHGGHIPGVPLRSTPGYSPLAPSALRSVDPILSKLSEEAMNLAICAKREHALARFLAMSG